MNNLDIEQFKTILEKEISLMSGCLEYRKDMKESLEKKNFKQLNAIIHKVNETSHEVVKVELEREKIYNNLKKSIGAVGDIRFDDFLSLMDEKNSSILKHLFNELKRVIFSVQQLFSYIDDYVKVANGTIEYIVDSMSQANSALVYNRFGQIKSTNSSNSLFISADI